MRDRREIKNDEIIVPTLAPDAGLGQPAILPRSGPLRLTSFYDRFYYGKKTKTNRLRKCFIAFDITRIKSNIVFKTCFGGKMKKLSLVIAALFILNLAADTLPPPEKDEMKFSELDAKLIDLDGKVIETEITSAVQFQQVGEGKYIANCCFFESSSSFIPCAYVLLPEEGKEFFQEIADKNILNGSSETIYLLVNSKNPKTFDGHKICKLEAVGTRFKKSKGTYSW